MEQLIAVFGPFILDLIRQWQDRNKTKDLPTLEQLKAHGAEILAEGAAWRSVHPDA